MKTEGEEAERRMMKIRDVFGPARNMFGNLAVGKPIILNHNWIVGQSSKLGCPQMALQSTAAGTAKQPNPASAVLPRLPVPALNETLDKYVKSVKPLITDEEFTITKKLVKDFGASGGIGEKLQKLLEERAKSKENWLSNWWLQSAYLDYRSPVVVFSSPGLVFPLQKFNSSAQRLQFTARLIAGALDYKTLIDQQLIPAERMGKDPLDMSQYYKVLGTCRIPGEIRDRLTFADHNEPPRHIVVAHNNHLFKVHVCNEGALPLSEAQILPQLQHIVEMSPQKTIPIGILTSENRNTWGLAYKQLSTDVVNRHSLHDIQTSLFLVCLDGANTTTQTPRNAQTLAALEMVHGGGSKLNGGNRWFDKTIQFVVGSDGGVGLTYEHSPAEGPPIANLMDHVVNYLEKGVPAQDSSSSVPPPERLEFVVSDTVRQAIATAEINLDLLVDDLHMSCFTFASYGKDFIKSQRHSPDSFIQMAIQFAFYRLHQEPGAHYESASARKFLHGRTETIRSCSEESVAFARAMLDKNTSVETKVKALATAINGHKAYTISAINGLGVDRHLLGLKLTALANGLDVPKLYLDAGFIRSSHFRISTSQVAAKCDAFMCYGALVPDGYACCYNPRDKEIVFGLSAFRSSPDTDVVKFHQALEASLKDMHDVLLQSQVKAKL